jgi:magnesium transporter
MLKTYPIADGQASPCGGAFWVDLLDPTAEESERVARECGVKVPSRESLQEIETSSRTRVEGDVLYMSMPLAIQDGSRGLAPVPLGFILSPQRLVTVRYSEVHAFAQVMERVQSDRRMNSASTFVALIDGMVDFDADMLEKLSGDLAAVPVAPSARAASRPRTTSITHARCASASTRWARWVSGCPASARPCSACNASSGSCPRRRATARRCCPSCART